MADDIVTRLRHAAVGLPQDDMNQTAADEIERLRAAGDALALSIETFVPGVLAHISIKQAFSDWQEARRG